MKRFAGFVGAAIFAVVVTLFFGCGKQYNADAMIGGGTVAHNHSSALSGGSSLAPATITMAGTLSSTKACASGYTRVTPNYCASVYNPGPVATISASTTCTLSTSIATTDAVAVDVLAFTKLYSGNAIAFRQAWTDIYSGSNTSCTGSINRVMYSSVYEFSATVNTPIYENTVTFTVPSDASGRFNYKTDSGLFSGGANSFINFYIIGYHD